MRNLTVFAFMLAIASCGRTESSLHEAAATDYKNIDICVDALKANAKKDVIDYVPNSQDSKEAPYQEYNKLVAASLLEKKSIPSEYVVTTKDKDTISLVINKRYPLKDYEFQFDHTITLAEDSIESPSNKDQKIRLLEYKLDLTQLKNSVREVELNRTYRIDYSNHCQLQETELELTTFTATQNDQLKVAYTKVDYLNNLVTKKEGTATKIQASLYPMMTSFDALNGGEKFDLFADLELGVMNVEVKKNDNIKIKNPINNEMEDARHFTIKTSQNNEVLYFHDIIDSAVNEYSLATSTVDNEHETRTTPELWSKTNLRRETKEVDVTFSGFEKGDFNTKNLEYELTTENELLFDNFANYFELKSVSKADHKFVYQVKNQPKVLHNSLSKPFPETVEEKFRPYLAETYYYNVSDPDIQKAVAEIKKALNGNNAQGLVTREILRAVNEHLAYDHKAVAQSSVDLIRACDALKRGQGVCQHFAAVFVTFARAMGIPARQVSGYKILDEDGKVTAGAHAWVEILINGKDWLPLEPQDEIELFITDSSFLPLTVSSEYETKIGASLNLSELFKSNDAFKKLNLKKISK